METGKECIETKASSNSRSEESTCSECGAENSFIEDTIGFEKTLVCQKCGNFKNVVEINDVTPKHTDVRPNGLIHGDSKFEIFQNNGSYKFVQHYKIHPLEKSIMEIGKKVCSDATVIEQAKYCFNIANTKMARMQKRKLAVVCLHQALLDHGYGISIHYLCKQFDVSFKHMIKISKYYNEFLKKETTLCRPERTIRHYGFYYHVEGIANSYPWYKDKKNLIPMIKEICILLKDFGTIGAMAAQNTIFLATYFAYISTFKTCKNVPSLGSFLKKLGKTTRYINLQYLPCKKLFIMFARHLPWVPEDTVTDKNYFHYISDVLKTKEVLKEKLMKDHSMKSNVEAICGPIIPLMEELDPHTLSSELNEKDLPNDEIHKYIYSKDELHIINKMNKTHNLKKKLPVE